MTVLHCSQKLLKRLRQPATLPEPPAAGNPLGPWHADIDFIDRSPFVVLINAATGTSLVLPARAADLKQLHAMSAEQLGGLLEACGIDGPLAQAELDALAHPFVFSRNSNRSMAASMNQRKYEIWTQFAYHRLTAFEAALRTLETPFRRKDLGPDYHFAAELLRRHLRPAAKILAFLPPQSRH
ncbi:DUF6933 domain-containing protein [Luteimonas terricola]|uniref:DUF6933 domain-containing protein n=1 Tax=Luteimonas terricola TaxID=645597 RepID=A0ABQ2EKT5_9GAMM|nr:hypothetical protein [Luteimonas terricola]GGK12633.1 hypothetical protein GCM10011394_22370 [Luteimonas terricola]